LIGSNKNAGTSTSAPLATLQAAANLVKAGDTVEVMNGTYTGPAGGDVVDITASGTSSAPITFEAAPGQTPVIDSSGAWNAIKVEASYIIINGFTVVGDAASYTLTQALAGYSGGNAALDGNGIAITPPTSSGVVSHITIENNTVYNEPGGGIYTGQADYVDILNNVVHDNAHWSGYGNSGISISTSMNSDTNPGVHDIVSGNISYNNQELVPVFGVGRITDGEGIILDTNPGFVGTIMVQGNTTHGNSGPGIESFKTNNAIINGNTAYNDLTNPSLASEGEIFINQSTNNTVTNNITVAPVLSGAVVLSAATEHVTLPASTNVATFTDPNLGDLASGFTALINWGDGTVATAATVSGSAGSFTVTAGHTYADEGSDPLSVTIIRTSDGASIAPTGTVVVGENDVLSGTGESFSVTASQSYSGAVASFKDTDLVTPASDLVATINWGDGTAATAGTVSGSAGLFTVSGTHTYTTAGTDTVTVTLSDDTPGTATAPATGTATVGAPTNLSPVNVGTGPDQLILLVSEDAYANSDGISDAAGDAEFTVSVDGKQIGGTLTAQASHASGAVQDFLINGSFGPGQHTVTVDFLNDAYGGSPTTDRNLYVAGASYDGVAAAGSLALYGDGPQSLVGGSAGSVPATVTVGSGPDTLDLKVSEDAWNGNAQFTVSVDGQQIGGTLTALTSHAAGATQDFLVEGIFGPGSHTATINFINDAYGGTPSTDRNLYVTGATIDGQAISGSTLNLYSNGAESFSFLGAGTSGTPPPSVVVGSGPDTLDLKVSEDAWNGNAQFTVSVDGQQIGGTLTALASHAAGATQDFLVESIFGPGSHTATVDFINDAYGGTSSTDRNLYVTGATINGQAISGSTVTLYSNGPQSFGFQEPTNPA
jgi:hypothetical protein